MKKLIYLGLLTIFMVSLPLLSKADGSNRTRNNCDWTGWKYKARARVNKFGMPERNTDKGCPGSYYFATVNNGCATQWAANWYGSHYEGGSVYKWQRWCARGNQQSELFYDYVSNRTDNEDYFEHGEYSTARVQFKNHKVIMDSINIKLQAKGEDLFSSFEIMMWLPQSENDTVESLNKSFLHGKITLLNGKVVGTGVFKDYVLKARKNSDGVYTVVVHDFKAVGLLPEGVTNKNSTIEVVTKSDGGIDEKAVIENAPNHNELSVKVFPNPTSELLNISLNSNDSDENYSVTLYDLNGKTISVIANSISSQDLLYYQINLGKIIENKGIYYLLIQSINSKKNTLQRIVFQ